MSGSKAYLLEECGGGHRRARQATERLENNIEAGDAIVDIVGFSRGAAIAVSFANEVASKLDDDVQVRFLGLFDRVGQFGLPGRRLSAGHVLTLPSNVRCCRHAMALDETRALFPLTRLCDNDGRHGEELLEVWFRGVHSDIGDGNGNRGLNWIPLHWMYMNARRAGLPIAQEAIDRNLADRDLPRQVSDPRFDLEHSAPSSRPTACTRAGVAWRPHNNPTIVLRRVTDEGAFVEAAGV